jgi:benzoyl-CoA reductase/2-hydroxyglutaryl-CoA dehydratase subunit BcrC/BadD/HgdB
MIERKEALATKAYQRLRDIYLNRDMAAAEWRAKGGRVVLLMGSDVPEEILYAANYLPVSVFSNYGAPTNTELYLEESCDHDAWARGVIQKLTDGTYFSTAERVVMSYSTMRMYNLFNVLREARRQMPDAPIPYVEFLDTDYDNTLLAQKHNINVYRKFRADVEKWTCQEISDERLQTAIDIYNEDRAAMRAFDALRRGSEVRVSGTEAMIVLGASLFMDKKEHASLVRELITAAAEWPILHGPRVFLTGSDQDLTELYDIVGELGGIIVMEDHNFGARIYENDVTYRADPIRGLVDRYIYRMPTGKVSIARRVETVRKCITDSAAEAVVMYLKVNDIGASWEYPHIKHMLDEMKIPIIKFYDQETPMSNAYEVRTAIGTLFNQLKGGK